MSPLTSVAGGVLVCALIGAFTSQHYSWIAFGCAAFGSQLPHWVERPWLTQRFGPQTISHSLLGLTVVGLFLSPLLFTHHSPLVTAFLLGYASHLLLDAATARGVLLFYPSRARAVMPQHPLGRVIPGSPREARLRYWLVGVCLVALPLNAVGLRGLLHQLLPVAQFAVEDYLSASNQGRRVFVDFTGRFNTSQRLVSGRWDVLDTMSSTSLLVEDPTGRRYTIGTHPHDTIQALSIRAHQGPPMDVQLHIIHLHDQVLGDLVSTIPPDGRTYLIGVLKTPEEIHTTFSLDQFHPIQVGSTQVELRYATARDLQEHHMMGLFVTEGELLLRTLREPSRGHPATALTQTPMVHSEASQKTVTLTVRHVHDPQELLIQPDQEVARDQLLADLQAYRATLLTEHHVALAQHATAHAVFEHLRLKDRKSVV